MTTPRRNETATHGRSSTLTEPESAPEREFVIERLFDAPRREVFRAWVDPSRLARWWGPKGMTTPVCELDARPGGAYRITMRSGEGVDFPLTGTYREVVEPERLVLTMDASEHPPEWHDLVRPGRAKGDDNPAGEFLLTVTFEDLAGRTKLTIRTLFESVAIRAAMVKMGMHEGWPSSLDRLSELLATRG